MRTIIVQALEDIATDPSFIDIVQSGPSMTWQDLLIGLLGILAWSAAYRYTTRLVFALARRIVSHTEP